MSDFKISEVWFELYTGEIVDNPDYGGLNRSPDEDETRTMIHTAEKAGMLVFGKKIITPEMEKELHLLLDTVIEKTNFILRKMEIS